MVFGHGRHSWGDGCSSAHPAIVAAILTVAGCAGTPSAHRTTPPPRAPTLAAPARAAVPASRPIVPEGAISRAPLDRFVNAGPQEFIQRVRVRPVFHEGRFRGWRILAYAGPGPIRRGDVVSRVNGQPIERPEEFMAVWNGLGHRHELVVELTRQGQPVTLRYPIVD